VDAKNVVHSSKEMTHSEPSDICRSKKVTYSVALKLRLTQPNGKASGTQPRPIFARSVRLANVQVSALDEILGVRLAASAIARILFEHHRGVRDDLAA
jgi:hypothetical protein